MNKEGIRIEIDIKRGCRRRSGIKSSLCAYPNAGDLRDQHGGLGSWSTTLFNLKQIIEAFVMHRREVVIRRSLFELRKARERTHILEGLAVATQISMKSSISSVNRKSVKKRQKN